MAVRPRRKSRLVFWILMMAVIAGIIATALLANDKRNLRELIQRYRITWITLDSLAPPKKLTAAKRGNRLLPSSSIVPSRLPPHTFASFKTNPSAFIRHWQVSGEELCGAFAKAGLDVGAWHQGDLYSSTYECSAQIDTKATAASGPASLFLLVRGTPTGDVSSVRIKVILPETEDGESVRQKFNAAVEILFTESKWADLAATFDQIKQLQNITQSTFGTKLFFGHEFTDPRRFNLILDLGASTPGERATAAYFDKSKWMALDPASLN